MQTGELRTGANDGIVDSDGYITLRWHVDDVTGLDPSLTDEEARTILGTVERRHDASIGVNFDVIQTHIDNFYAVQPGARRPYRSY